MPVRQVTLFQSAHCPLPSHVPFCPQLPSDSTAQMGWPATGFIPAGTSLHVPTKPARLHALQLSTHRVWQQTPSAQAPDRQSEGSAQGAPSARLPEGASAVAGDSDATSSGIAVPPSREPSFVAPSSDETSSEASEPFGPLPREKSPRILAHPHARPSAKRATINPPRRRPVLRVTAASRRVRPLESTPVGSVLRNVRGTQGTGWRRYLFSRTEVAKLRLDRIRNPIERIADPTRQAQPNTR